MEEIVTIEGRQYKLSYNQPLTAEQRLQTIEEIRKSNEHNIYKGAVKTVGQTDNVRQLSAGMSIS